MKESKLFKSLVATSVIVALGGPAVALASTSSNFEDAEAIVSYADLNLEMADGVEISSKNRTDIRATADVDGDQEDVIEEIVVIGKKKGKLPNLGSSLDTDPVVQKPSRVNWEFLPNYDPEQAYPYFDQLQLDQEIRRTGFIQLFRVRFGR